ncbi:DedA family protein [Edaphobacillus lindanitolerans]|uniref:Membrane protein DedA, SNARE-associated domain n=1 Tax=Edaphobacillus lindanitolerans TaxID=550447 RepID=A0A1U7PME4_9BACI|nr:DedA family protein [Edaphobacillus lindanitolerans]SIT84252.1 membrane protein DedA, SNARE-associated domain [Edaphobacillus lindanitolerans]
MGIDQAIGYVQQYGYLIIFLLALFGIVGIPAPEESMVFLTGMLIAENQLGAAGSVACTISGVFAGMLVAYFGGRWIGTPLLRKVGGWVGLTKSRLEKLESRFSERRGPVILFGFYLPGFRQLSPYFAGMTKVPLPLFAGLSLMGTVLWTGPFLVAGYVLGKLFDIDPAYASYAGILFLAVYLVYLLAARTKRKNRG